MTLQQIVENLVKFREKVFFKNVLELNVLLFLTMKKIKRKYLDILHKFKSVLNFKKIENLVKHNLYNYKIELIDDIFKLARNKIYTLLSKKLEILNKYIKKIFFKKFINFNKTFFVSSILFVIKFNKFLKFCVNYRKFNVITKRNDYSIFLIKKTLTRVIDCKYILKLNIIFVFNCLRINFDNEKFIIFIIFLRNYKYHVLFFELINDFVN